MRTKNSAVFLVFLLMMLVGWIELDQSFRDYFSDRNEILAHSESLARSLERQKLKVQLIDEQNWDFQQEVARLLPVRNRIQNHRDFQLAELAQTVRTPASEVHGDLMSELLMARGREAFQQKDYEKSSLIFRELIEKFPTSAQVVEAHFLWGESLYRAGRSDECLDVVYQMLNQFPDSEMTGYLMLRDGQILQARNRTQEAAEVFHIITERFAAHKALQDQARRLASE